VRCPDDETTAYFFIPDDPRLRQFASDIREQRDAVLGQPKNPRSPRDDASDIVRPLFIPMSSTHTAEGTIAGDAHLLPNELAYADRVRLAHPDTAALSRERVAILLRSAQQHARGPAVGDATPAEDVTATLRQLRTLNNSAANRIAFKYQVSHDEVNRTLNRLVGIRSVRSCTQPTTLERRLQTAAAWLASGEVPTEEARLG
jgi:hypothetical protein